MPGVGTDAQSVINEQTKTIELYIGAIRARFGAPTPRAGSGTEDEFLQAYGRYKSDSTSVRLLIYFLRGSDDVLALDPGQLAKVQEFRKKIGAAGVLYADVQGPDELLAAFKQHLIRLVNEQWLDDKWRAAAVPTIPIEAPTEFETGEGKVTPPVTLESMEERPGVLDLIVDFDSSINVPAAACLDVCLETAKQHQGLPERGCPFMVAEVRERVASYLAECFPFGAYCISDSEVRTSDLKFPRLPPAGPILRAVARSSPWPGSNSIDAPRRRG